MAFQLETHRFLLREFTPDDAINLYNLNADEEVIRYTGDKAFKSEEEALRFIKQYDQYALYGYGRWAVIDKQSGEFTGWCGLKYDPVKDETDLGYRFFRKHWNKGYATETAAACLRAAFEIFGLETVIARAAKENIGSIKVMEKIGMKYKEELECGHDPGVVYELKVEN